MPTSADTLPRIIRQTRFPSASGVRVVGVDDWPARQRAPPRWAFRKGVSYGTILLDLDWIAEAKASAH